LKFLKDYWKYLRQMAIYVFLLAVFIGTINYLLSRPRISLLLSYKATFVYTLACTLFCSVFLIRSFDHIYRLPRAVFYALFTFLVAAGIFLGVVTGNLILFKRPWLDVQTLVFSFIMGIIFSAVFSGYFIMRDRLEQKISRLKEIELENEKLKRMELEARLNDLRAKLNPHFLFNILNTTAALIYDDPAKAEQSVVRLSSLYRRLLSLSSQAFVSVGEEVELVSDYLELERLRFSDQLAYRIIVPETLKNEKIPALLIEPLVENAVKHCLEPTRESLSLEVNVRKDGPNIVIAVRDDGPGFDVGKSGFGFGLFSIQERLRLLFGNNHTFGISSREREGTEVLIRIPASIE
jgi:two-component system LytT family sensor kinase